MQETNTEIYPKKKKKREYGRKRYPNISKENKQKLKKLPKKLSWRQKDK